MKSRAICSVLLLVSFAIFVKAQEKKMKIYISADMEGVVGAVTNEQLGPQGFEYARFREFMTQEVNAAIEAAFEAGATEIVASQIPSPQRLGGIRITDFYSKSVL